MTDETVEIHGTPLHQRFERSVSRYRVIRQLGAGGMGVVYEAEQLNPQRLVALKVIRGGEAVDPQRVKLFEREAHALGRLKHPSIATLYEMGSTDSGEPFFAMELVRGSTLDVALAVSGERSRMRLEDDLRLFIRIAEAINYAHQRGVIHRDLKPSNILVAPPSTTTSSGPRRVPDVKILDFGLARITDADMAHVSMAAGVVQGTLAYMSPEQARGNPDEIDVRSDVYSLGMILYEVLTGRRPYEMEGRPTLEVLRVICEESPARPTELLKQGPSGDRRASRLDRDLETIVMKALEKDPNQRYQSALALAEDLERYLADQPILARPPTAAYQLRKLVSRNRAGFAASAGTVVLLAIFAALMTAQVRQTARERDRAETEAARANAINAFLQEMLGSANPIEGRGRDATVREVLDDAAARAGEDFTGQPDVEASVRATLGLTYYRLGRFDQAEEQLRTSLRLQQRLLQAPDSLRFETLIALAVAVHDLGRHDEAESMYREALKIAGEIPGLDPGHETAALNNLALLLFDEGRLGEAEEIFREVVRRDRSRGEATPDVAIDLNNLARVLQTRGELGEAERLFRESHGILEEHGHPYADIVLGSLAATLCAAGDLSGAEPMFDAAFAKAAESLGEEHAEVAGIQAKRGECLLRRGQGARAEEPLRLARQGLGTALGDRHPRTQKAIALLVELYESDGRDDQAAPLRALLQPPAPAAQPDRP